MATGSTTTTGLGALEGDRDLPVSELNPLHPNKLFTVACMGLVANPTGAALATVDDVHVMKVPVAIAETGINSGLREAKQVLFMASQT